MKALVLLLFVALAAAVPRDARFDQFLGKYGKHYDGKEYTRRLATFNENLKKAEYMTAQGGATFGVTKFSDMTEEEFQSTVLMAPQDPSHLAAACLRQGVYAPHVADGAMTHPDSLDWTTVTNVVTSVKDQKSCGSCWAFSTVENIEGLNGMAKNAFAGQDLSPQFLVDCSKGCSSEIYNNANTTVCNGGCNGGWPWTAMDDLTASDHGSYIGANGIPLWTDYTYTGFSGTCKAFTATKIKISGFQCIGLDLKDNEDEIAEYLYNLGPLSIALNANPFQSYKSGIIHPALCGTSALNHAVLLVGYGTDNGTPYWKIKNSWGPAWGESGYCRLYRGAGTCGVNEAVTCGTL